MFIIEYLRNLMGANVTLLVVQGVIIVLLGIMIALVFFTIRGLVMYVLESRAKSKIRKGRS